MSGLGLARLHRAWWWRVERPWRFASRFHVPGQDEAAGRWAYLGYVGHRNYGDDVLYEAVARRMLPGPTHEVADLKPLPASLKSGVDLAGFDAVVIGGGTLIYREAYLDLAERALELGLPVIVAGTGVGDIGYWQGHLPEVRFGDLIARWNRVLQAAVLVGVRGPRSVAALRELGPVEAELIGDPALSMTSGVPLHPARRGVIGLNLGTHDPIWGDQGELNAQIVRFARTQIARGREVRFISMSPIDTKLGRRLEREIRSRAFRIVERPEEIEPAIAGCEMVIGQRLHSVILACAWGVPTLSLAYQPKCLDFLESIGFPELALKTSEITAEGLADSVAELETRWEETSRKLIVAVRGFQQTQSEFGRKALAAAGAGG